VGYDNLSTGLSEFSTARGAIRASAWSRATRSMPPALAAAMQGAELVFHLAANADVRFGTEHPRRDLEQNTIATFNVLEAMRPCGAKRIAFSSTGSIYGEPRCFRRPRTRRSRSRPRSTAPRSWRAKA
jgi:UDP-glucose 4-epimerase